MKKALAPIMMDNNHTCKVFDSFSLLIDMTVVDEPRKYCGRFLMTTIERQ
jgi:hypothetical protein